MQIAGMISLSLQDYPGKLACVLFTPGCQLRCPFCHNSELALADLKGQMPDGTFIDSVDKAKVFDFLNKRKNVLEAVVISGGEPTLQPGLPDFLRQLRQFPYLLKMDTNGFNPKVLKKLLDENLLDYVAMDLKNRPLNYALTAGIPSFQPQPILESMKLIQKSGIDHEFRTTVVKELHSLEDLIGLKEWPIADSPLVLQTFRDGPTVMEKGFNPYTDEEMGAFLKELKGQIKNVSWRSEDE